MMPPREPTADECYSLAPLGNGWHGCWYPQMGGYAGKAAIWVDEKNFDGCVEVFVWHDGEFPFSDGDVDGWSGETRKPVELHHCDEQQFRKFADDIAAIREKRSPQPING